MTDCAIGPRFPDRPKTLAEQLETAVRANQCEALTVTGSPWSVRQKERYVQHVFRAPGDRCDSLNTTFHSTLGKRLCWVHRHAAENFERSTALRFVEKATK